jgi:hypothetical protein
VAGLLRVFMDRVARRDSSSRIQHAARRHAMRAGSDGDVCREMQGDLGDFPRVALVAEIAGWHPRQDYVNDRAYRLLVGVRDGGVVPPIEAECRDRFAREEELGRLPLPEAFARIAATAPSLVEMEQRARTGARPKIGELRDLMKSSGLELHETELGVVWQQLGSCARGRVDPTPLFDRDAVFQAHVSRPAWPEA